MTDNNPHEQVLQLLITGGFLNPGKLQEARDIIKGCAPSPGDNHSLEEAAKQYATPHFPEMGGLYEKIKVAFLAGAAYVKGGEGLVDELRKANPYTEDYSNSYWKDKHNAWERSCDKLRELLNRKHDIQG